MQTWIQLLFAAYFASASPPKGLPHCKRTTVVTGEIMEENFETAEIRVATTVELKLALDETACFHVHLNESSGGSNGFTYNESILYAIQYSSLEHHHPVRQQYQFGIPHITSHCVCDCSGGEDHCQVGYAYKNCTQGAACFTTYHAHKRATGCPVSADAELCCDVVLNPYKDLRFTALKLGVPELVAVFTFQLFTIANGVWRAASSNRIQVPLNKGQTFSLGQENLRLQVSGDVPSRSIDSGVYFLGANETSIRSGVPVNELREWNVGKLGWFRVEKGKWSVRSGGLKLQDAHHTSVRNCKDQDYLDSYNAEGYVADNYEALGGKTFHNYHLGYFIEELEPWIAASDYRSRNVIITHRTSPFLTLDLTMDNRPLLKFFHHTSSFKDFTGSIHLDRHSNTFLNVTFFSGRGTQVGSVFRGSDRKVMDIAFSTYMKAEENYSTLLALPSSVNSSRWVCFYPAGAPEREKCKWLEYFKKPLDWFVVPHQWTLKHGDCEGCNDISVSNFMKYLNPSQWFDGISSTSEAIAMGFELVLYLIVFLIVFAVLRKCVCPFLKWTICTGDSQKRTAVNA